MVVPPSASIARVGHTGSPLFLIFCFFAEISIGSGGSAFVR
jgi:hypothetical protein